MDDAIKGRWAVAGMFATNGFTMGVWAPQIPLLLERHQISTSTLGLLILGLGLGAVSAMLFTGRLIAAHGSRTVARGFAVALIPCLPLVVFAPNLWLLAPLMMLLGGFLGSMDVAMNANAVEVERRLRMAIMSSSHGFWSLGGFIGAIAGSYAVVHWGAQVQALVAAAAMALVVMWSWSGLVQDAAPTRQHGQESTQKTQFLPRDLGLWIMGFMALFSMLPEGAVLDWAAIYLSHELGSDLFRAGLAFALFSGAMAIMRFAGDRIRNRFGAVKTLRISAIVTAAGLLAAAASPDDLMAIAGFALAGLGIANVVPILFSAAGNHPTLPSGIAISTVTMVGYAGILVAPSTIGYVAEFIGFRATYASLGMIMLIVAAMAGRAAAADRAHTDT